MTVENKQPTSKQGFWLRAWPYLAIALVTFIAHGFLLLMDWTFWEGARNYPIIISRDPAQMDAWIDEKIPIFIPYLIMLGSFPNAFFASHLVSFVSFFACGVLIYQICHVSGFVNRMESLWLALLTVLYPVFQMAIVNTVAAYIFGYAIFLGGVLLALRISFSTGWRHWVQRILALLFFLIGFNFLQSLYVFHFGFLLFYLFFLLKHEGLALTTGLKTWLPRRLDFILLPFLAWWIRQNIYPSGRGYNTFTTNIQLMLRWLRNFVINGFLEPVFVLLTRHWWLTLLVLFGVVLLFHFFPKRKQRVVDAFDGQAVYWVWLVFGIVLFILAVFPYVVVNRAGPTQSIFSSTPFDSDTRHTTLLGLPIAILLLTLARWLIFNRRSLLTALGITLLVVFAAESALTHIQNYADWQLRAIKDHSFVAQLAEMEEVSPYPVIWVYDEFPVGGMRFKEDMGFYAPGELKLIANFAWPEAGPHSWIDSQYRDLDQGEFMERDLRYLNPDAGLENCQAELILRRNPDAGSDLNVLTHYYYYKFFRGEEVLQGYLKGNYRLTLVFFKPSEVQPVEGCP